jgi:hypothetical protein
MHCRRRNLEIPLKIGLGWRCPMELRIPVNEGQILTLLRCKPGLQRGRGTDCLGDWRLVSELLQQGTEPIADRIERTLDFAVIAMIRFGRHAAKEVVDVVQIQVDDEPGADPGSLLEDFLDFRIQERPLDHEITFARRESDRELCPGLDVFSNHS